VRRRHLPFPAAFRYPRPTRSGAVLTRLRRGPDRAGASRFRPLRCGPPPAVPALAPQAVAGGFARCAAGRCPANPAVAARAVSSGSAVAARAGAVRGLAWPGSVHPAWSGPAPCTRAGPARLRSPALADPGPFTAVRCSGRASCRARRGGLPSVSCGPVLVVRAGSVAGGGGWVPAGRCPGVPLSRWPLVRVSPSVPSWWPGRRGGRRVGCPGVRVGSGLLVFNRGAVTVFPYIFGR
jgi:hypothetical protein